MCPITAYCHLFKLTEIQRGYVFRRRTQSGYFDQDTHRVLVSTTACHSLRTTAITPAQSSDSLLNAFRNNLLDIKRDPRLFGTHSFRRGGCQYLAVTLRWHIRDVCSWGGWADNFDNPGTIFKYLLSFVDGHVTRREDFLNPDRKAAPKCEACGRDCWCAPL